MIKTLNPFNVILLLLILMLFPMSAMAAGTMQATSQPIVRDIQSQELGTIRVVLEAGSVNHGDLVIVQLPDFATFRGGFDPMVQTNYGKNVNRLVVPLSYNGNTIWDGVTSPFRVQRAENDRLIIESSVNQSLEQDYVFYIQLGNVDIENGSQGAITINFEPSSGSGFPSGDVTVGKVFGDNKTMNLTSTEFEQRDETFTFDLTIEENQAGAFEDNKTLKLKLPKNYKWINFEKVTTVKGQTANIQVGEVGGQETTITLLSREGTLQESSWKIPVVFMISDASSVQSGNIAVEVQWGQSYQLTIGAYTKPKPKEYVTFKIGSLTYSVGEHKFDMDVAPYILDGRTYLPVRYVAKVLGVDQDNIRWNGVTQTVTISKNSKVVQLKVGSNVMSKDDITITMDTVVESRDGRLMLPIRYLTEAFDTPINWDKNEQSIKIEKR